MQRTLTALTLLAAGVTALPWPLSKRDPAFDYNNQKVRGVNLGGWFVLEPWITPSLFNEWATSQTVVDEYTMCQTLGSQECYNRLNSHWGSWIQENDFQSIAGAGLNHVRIPLGYWAVSPQSGDPYVQGQLPYLDQAIVWARNSGLKVLIDIHGMPGSQNGFDNSGRRGNITWQTADPNRDIAKGVVNALAARYANDQDVVTMIEAVNEPANWGLDMDWVKQYYYDAWGNIRQSAANIALTIHDAFEQPDSYWNGFMNAASGIDYVVLDTHQYQIFSDAEVSRTLQQHVNYACNTVGPFITDTDKWTIVGEWSAALTDCTQWLNGLGKGARYDGTFYDGGQTQQNQYGSCNGKYQGDVNSFSAADKKATRQYIEAQLDAYESHTGWIYWTWKAEDAPEWAMNNLLTAGLFPQPLTDRQYPNQCSGATY